MFELLRFMLSYQTTVLKKWFNRSELFDGDDDDGTECGALIIIRIGTLAILFHILNSQNTAIKSRSGTVHNETWRTFIE